MPLKSPGPVLILGFFLATPALADRGSISYKDAQIDIEEPGQKAILGWCRGEEVLILATELRASQPTEVLEIMPFPSAPAISRGTYDSFRALNRISEKNRKSLSSRGGKPAP